jgi:hypothetical protein
MAFEGTYIKEFIHGDFGRTQPSLCTLLECAADILSLDVEVGGVFFWCTVSLSRCFFLLFFVGTLSRVSTKPQFMPQYTVYVHV